MRLPPERSGHHGSPMNSQRQVACSLRSASDRLPQAWQQVLTKEEFLEVLSFSWLKVFNRVSRERKGRYRFQGG